MKLRDDVNEYGTPITVFKCDFCGEEYSVCPAIPDVKLDDWNGCQMEWCESYDESRDANKMFDDPDVEFVNLGMKN